MKRRRTDLKSLCTYGILFTMLISSAGICHAAPNDESKASNEATKENRIEIRTAEEFMTFAKQCYSDLWSMNVNVILMSDIDLSQIEFEGIPYFSGTFDGKGHTISGMRISAKGSDLGFFRYIGETAQVKNLSVSGSIAPGGSQENIGGIAGVNYGTIENCSFEGSLSAQKTVGAIAGYNAESGTITGCESNAIVLATDYTGGIAGKNDGVISACTSKSSVNIEELEPTLDLGGIDVGTMNLSQNMINRNNMGGIAGYSAGLITYCKNEGTVGYQHTGYNVGGIVGGQNGIILMCVNRGAIYGRKDVGGIVGQALPYIETEYLDDKIEQTKTDINRLNRTVNNISSTLKDTSQEVSDYSDKLSDQYQDSLDNISDNLDDLSDSISDEHPEAKGYVNNINDAMDRIQAIQSSGSALTQEQIDSIQNNLKVINDNLGNLQNVYSGSGESAENLVNQISDELKQNGDNQQEAKDLANSVDANVQVIADNLSSMSDQISNMADSMSEDLSVLMGDEEVIVDISSIESAEDMSGVISECVNRGEVHGDLNVGGIAGTMNVEYEGDPELDVDMTKDTSVSLRSTVNNVVLHCINYGRIYAKKNCAGGIAGLQELGLIYDCEGYGEVSSDSGSYLGGIAGNSKSTIQESYSLCTVFGTDYVGGICGNGYTLQDNISVATIEAEGEKSGSISGNAEKEGTIKGNYYAESDVHGIDGISYAGAAEEKSYDEIMAMEDIPAGFQTVKVTFEIEEEVLSEKWIPYGSEMDETVFPDIAEKEGYYIQWPNLDELNPIRENQTITAEYIPWTQSVAGTQKAENGKHIFLVVGDFYDDTTIQLEEINGPQMTDENASLTYAYAWKLESERKKEISSVEGHFLVPETEGEVQLWICKDGTWTETEFTEDGSYLVAELPYGADFAVTVTETDYFIYYIIAGIAGVAIFLIFVIVIRRVKKKKSNKKGSDRS